MLRERIPDFDLALDAPVRDEPIPRSRDPVTVGFRVGGNLREVISTVQANRAAAVDAAPGAGKTTRLPGEIAEEMGCVVLHIFPNERMAYSAHKRIEEVGRNAVLILDTATPYPTTGVVCLPAAVVVARWLEVRAVVMPDCVVYHDESHESDAYTWLVKNLAQAAEGVRSYVSATATAGANGFKSLETQGALRCHEHFGGVTSWDPYDTTGPWGLQTLRDNALMFVDSRSAAAQLLEAYNSVGYRAYRIHSRMELDAFRKAVQALDDERSPVVVLISDSSHRSGFTFRVSTIIDSGRIGYLDTSTGRPVRKTRPMYLAEQHQTAARGGRIPGLVTDYYYPGNEKPELKICDLEAVDAEAVALILRLLGYRLPREFADCVMASGGVPRDVRQALQGEQPLALMRPDQLVDIDELTMPSGRRSPYLVADILDAGPKPIDVRDVRVSADVAREVGQQRYARPEPTAYEEAGFEDTVSRRDSGIGIEPQSTRRTRAGFQHPGWEDSWQEDLGSLLTVDTGVDRMKVGRAYGATGLETETSQSVAFPDGADSVLRLMRDPDKHGDLVSLGAWHKSVAVNLLLGRQGALAAEMDGIRRVVATVKQEAKGIGTPAVRRLAVQIAERLGEVSSSLTHVGDVLMRLGKGFCAYHEMEINAAASTEVYDNWMSVWRSVPRVDTRGALREGFTIRREGSDANRRLVSSVQSRIADRPYVPMASRGAGMRAIGAGIASTVSSGSTSVATVDRCSGQTYWDESLRVQSGRLCRVRTLVCDTCGRGASKRLHGHK